MNKKGDFNIVGMILAILTVGLFFSTITFFIDTNSEVYDVTGYDNTTFNSFSEIASNTTKTLEQQSQVIDKEANVDKDALDYLSSIFNKVLSPFKFIYRSYESVQTMIGTAISIFGLPSFFIDYLWAVIITLVIVGVVLLNLYLGRQK